MCSLIAIFVSLMYILIIQPKFFPSYLEYNNLDPDGYGRLANGLIENSSLAYYPGTAPTVNRGPVYPAFIALIYAVSGGSNHAVLISQALILGATVWMVHALALSFSHGRRRLALFAGLGCALFPYLIWFSGRMLVELLMAFLVTLAMTVLVHLVRSPSKYKAIALGLVLGILALTKQTMLPFLILIPLFLPLLRDSLVSWRLSSLVVISGIVVVGTWSLRNVVLTGRFIPVHLLAGVNLFIGNDVAERFFDYPFQLEPLFNHANDAAITRIAEVVPEDLTQPARDVAIEELLLSDGLQRLLSDPLFLMKKILINVLMFWTIGFDVSKTILISVFQLPLLILFCTAGWRLVRAKMLLSVPGLCMAVVWIYFLLHLPIFALPRYSMVMVPLMIASSCSLTSAVKTSVVNTQ